MKKTAAWVLVSSLVCLVFATGIGEVVARSAERVFSGRVLILNKRPPSYFRTKGGFVGFLRKHSVKTVYENSNREWNFETMSFFKKPLGDYEVQMVFYNIKNGRGKDQRKFVDTFTQYTQDRNTRSLSGKTRLIRPAFDANIRYQVVAKSRGQELARGEFSTKGTSQAAIDQQKRYEHMQKEMDKKMKELEKAAKEQEEREKKQNQKAAGDLF